VKLEALKIDGRLTKWTALIILEMAIGVYCIVMPSKTAILLLVLVPIAIIMMSNYFFAYLLGIFLLPSICGFQMLVSLLQGLAGSQIE
jgi:hypothetical protein